MIDRLIAVSDGVPRGLLAAVALVVVLVPFVVPSSLLFTATLVFVYAIVAYSAIVPIGYLGQLILAQGAFFGIGAYGLVKLTSVGVPSWGAVALATLLTTAIAYVIGRIAITTQEIQLGIVTLAFNELFVIGLTIFPDFLGGSKGVPAPELAFPIWLPVDIDVLYYYVAVLFFLGTYLVFRQLLTSELGWAFLAIREDRVVAESIGIDSRKYRIRSFVLSGAACGVGGALYAPVVGYISPPTFGVAQSVNIILIGVIGGIGAPIGGILGSPVAVLLPNLLQVVSEYRTVIYAVLLIGLLIYFPGGISGWLKDRF
jgi:branched-chain amino acid transport system permease protein